MTEYKWLDFKIPSRIKPALDRYVKEGILPGGFLQAVISNDLTEACFRADDENLKNIPAYVHYLYNEVPMECWGSKEKMERWSINVRKKRDEEMKGNYLLVESTDRVILEITSSLRYAIKQYLDELTRQSSWWNVCVYYSEEPCEEGPYIDEEGVTPLLVCYGLLKGDEIKKRDEFLKELKVKDQELYQELIDALYYSN